MSMHVCVTALVVCNVRGAGILRAVHDSAVYL